MVVVIFLQSRAEQSSSPFVFVYCCNCCMRCLCVSWLSIDYFRQCWMDATATGQCKLAMCSCSRASTAACTVVRLVCGRMSHSTTNIDNRSKFNSRPLWLLCVKLKLKLRTNDRNGRLRLRIRNTLRTVVSFGHQAFHILVCFPEWVD